MTRRIKEPASISTPVFIRFPKKGQKDPYTGLSYDAIDRLVRPQKANNFKPPVESRVLQTRAGHAAQRGARLINFQSLLDYIESGPVVNAPIAEKRSRRKSSKAIVA